MAVAHSSASESHTGTTGSASQAAFSWTHTQTGTPQGVVVFVSTYASTTSLVTSVTYGGAALTRITGGVALDSAGELGRLDTFFLGSGLASGNQTITVNRTNNATVMYAAAATVTAGANTTIPESTIVLLQGDGTLAAQSVDDTSPGQNSVRYAGGYSGLNTPPTAGTGSTLLNSIDIGNYGSALVQETTAGQGARSIGFTGASDDRAVVHLAIRELVPRTLAIDAKALTVSGIATAILANRNVTAAAAAYVETGISNTLKASKTLTATASNFTLSGQNVALPYVSNRSLTAEAGSYTFSAPTTTLSKACSLICAAGTVALSGEATALTKSSRISASTESVSLSASDSNLKHNYTGTVLPGTVNLGSASAGLSHNRRLAPEPGAHTLNGPATGVSRTYVAATEPGEVVLTPPASALRLQAALPATSGEVLLSPTQTGFTRTYVLAGGVASFTFSGQAASLGSVTNLAAETAPYVLSTSASQLSRTYTLQPQVAPLALSTTEIGLLTHRNIPAATEPFIITGGSAAVPRTFVLQPLAQGFVLTGQSAQLSNVISYTLTALGGAYTHLGESTGLQATRLITPEAAALAVSTPDAGVRRLYTLSNAVGQLSEIAYQAALRHDRQARTESNPYILTGISSALRQALLLSSSPGSFTLTSINPVLTDPTIRRLAMPTDSDSINLGFTEVNLFTFSRRRHIFFC